MNTPSTKRRRGARILIMGLITLLFGTMALPATAAATTSANSAAETSVLAATASCKVSNIASKAIYVDDYLTSSVRTIRIAGYSSGSIGDCDIIRVVKPWYIPCTRYDMIIWVNGRRYEENDCSFAASYYVPLGATVKVAAFYHPVPA